MSTARDHRPLSERLAALGLNTHQVALICSAWPAEKIARLANGEAELLARVPDADRLRASIARDCERWGCE